MRFPSVQYVIATCSLVACQGSQTAERANDALRGLDPTEAATIHRDAYGVPHVVADSDEAAFYGLGWASAQDRLYQMNVIALTVQGRLAEHFGDVDGMLASDEHARIVGSWRAAQRKALGLDAETHALLAAYADGVNAWVSAHPDRGPLFATSTVTPQRWTVAHCLAAWHELADGYAGSALGEAAGRVAFEADVARLGRDRAIALWRDKLDGGQPDHGVVQLDDLDRGYVDAVNRYAASLGFDGDDVNPPTIGGTGPHFSHAYAVSGRRTEDGGALLVADPQLPVTLPSVWQEVALSSPGFSVRGVVTPGSPAIAIGASDAVAWGVTAGAGDQADLYRLSPGSRADRYTIDGVEHDMEVHVETIEVLGGASVEVTYRGTRWGPVVTDLLDDPDADYALATVLLTEDDRDTAQGMIGMMGARDLDTFKAALDGWRSPNVNLVAADAVGNIYYSLIGAIPLRAHTAPLSGWVAQLGDTEDNAWLDIIPHALMPQVTNPGSGAVYSANHRPAGAWYPLPLSLPINAGGHSHRSARLRDQLDNDRVFSMDALLDEVQNDCVDGSRQRLVAFAAHVVDAAPGAMSVEAERLVQTLRDWSQTGSMASDVLEAWPAAKLLLSFREAQTGPALAKAYGTGAGGLVAWLDDMEARLADDPRYVPDRDGVAYLDLLFRDASDAISLPSSDWIETWQAETATMVLDYHVDLDGMRTAPEWSIATDVLPCAFGNTIWSQRSQSYSLAVDFAAQPQSLLPPGHHELRAEPALQSERSNWQDGRFKPAPIARDEIERISVSAEIVSVPK